MAVTNVLMCGVGGQGIILASEVLAKVAAESGLDVKKSDVHGMAQRGGSVTSHVRFGDKVYSPLIPDGEADILFASEYLEGLRYLPHLKPDGKAVVNTQEIYPPTVSRGECSYPGEIIGAVRECDPDCVAIQCLETARECGNVKTATVVLLGALSMLLGFDYDLWMKILKEEVPKKAVDVNVVAFDKGRELGARD